MKRLTRFGVAGCLLLAWTSAGLAMDPGAGAPFMRPGLGTVQPVFSGVGLAVAASDAKTEGLTIAELDIAKVLTPEGGKPLTGPATLVPGGADQPPDLVSNVKTPVADGGPPEEASLIARFAFGGHLYLVKIIKTDLEGFEADLFDPTMIADRGPAAMLQVPVGHISAKVGHGDALHRVATLKVKIKQAQDQASGEYTATLIEPAPATARSRGQAMQPSPAPRSGGT